MIPTLGLQGIDARQTVVSHMNVMWGCLMASGLKLELNISNKPTCKRIILVRFSYMKGKGMGCEKSTMLQE